MGSNTHYPEERPLRRATVSAFALEEHAVTNAQFLAFVQATGYITTAQAQGASHVFYMTKSPVDLNNPKQWWHSIPGANWLIDQSNNERPQDWLQRPVVHVSQADAQAYANWLGRRLPTEAEWEYAARGGNYHADTPPSCYAWGEEFAPQGERMAHVWQGAFPWYHATMAQPAPLPVKQFRANAFGLYDLIGNVWEWTSSPFMQVAKKPCCTPADPGQALFALKGGSFLCAAEYCLRYRPAARIGAGPQTSTSHIGFRCAVLA